MATVIVGQSTTGLQRDREGFRTYKLFTLVEGLTTDGPFAALSTPGLPQPGDAWDFFGDSDPWSYCTQEAEVRPYGRGKEQHPGNCWEVVQSFSNRADEKRCKDQAIEDPLLTPDEITGGFSLYNLEASYDRFGEPIQTSSLEVVRGPQIEFDEVKGVVRVRQNRAALQLPLLAALANTVNDKEMWGLPPRCIKFLPAGWSRKFWGQCSVYYERTLEFHVWAKRTAGGSLESGWDRELRDEGTRVLNGEWDQTTHEWILKNINGRPPNKSNPAHFKVAKDLHGTPFKVVLDGNGAPWSPGFPTTFACPSLPNGAAAEWKASGFDTDGVFKKFNGVTLTQTDLCEWEGAAEGGATITMDHSTVRARWELQIEGVAGQPTTTWSLPDADFDGLGANEFGDPQFLAVEDPDVSPRKVMIKPKGGTDPGTIRVEKYQESNLFVLGIPTALE